MSLLLFAYDVRHFSVTPVVELAKSKYYQIPKLHATIVNPNPHFEKLCKLEDDIRLLSWWKIANDLTSVFPNSRNGCQQTAQQQHLFNEGVLAKNTVSIRACVRL